MTDPWIEKGWRMQRETECLSNVTILKVALSLEKEQSEVPDYDTAAVISLHYLVLALRKTEKGRPYCVSIMFLKLYCGSGKR